MSEKHTPEWWEVKCDGANGFAVGPVAGPVVCRVLHAGSMANEEGKARAEQIVREHNSHADLLAACRKALTCGSIDSSVRQIIDDAIAKAKKVHP